MNEVYQIIPILQIDDDETFNCRGKITPIDVIDLAKDIKLNGLHQPVVVSIYDEANQARTGKQYRMLAGFRRLMAHRVNEMKEIACIIKPTMSELDALKVNLSENIQRQQLNILQEALAIKRMKDLGLTESETADSLGMSRGWVQVRFMLLSLPDEVRQEAVVGYISQSNIRDLYTLYNKTGDKNQLFEAVKKLKEGKARGQEVRVAQTKQQILKEKRLRKRPEIFKMMEHIQESGIGNGLHTRCMSWCAGEISTEDLLWTFREYADTNGLTYSATSILDGAA